jgi:large subunit ribosomal protein L7Ae
MEVEGGIKMAEDQKEIVEKAYEAVEVARTTGRIKKGTNECTKAIERKSAKLVVYAENTSPKEIVMHLPILAKEKDVLCVEVPSKEELGAAAGIPVATSAVAVIKDGEASSIINFIKDNLKKGKKEEVKKEETEEAPMEDSKEEKKEEEKEKAKAKEEAKEEVKEVKEEKKEEKKEDKKAEESKAKEPKAGAKDKKEEETKENPEEKKQSKARSKRKTKKEEIKKDSADAKKKE